MKHSFKIINLWLLSLVENMGLLVIAIATIIAMYSEIMFMAGTLRVTLADLLLLFLYMEILAMVRLHYSTGKMPVRFPLYIGMVALARYLILDMKDMEGWRMLAVSGSILILTLAVFLIRFGHVNYPYRDDPSKK